MPNRILSIAALGLFVALGLAACTEKQNTAAKAPPAAPAAPCDADCLSGFVDQYLAALAAHDPSRLPLAQNVRFTENGQALPLGEALWVTNNGLGKYKNVFTDPDAGEVGAYVTVMENNLPDILALRLKIVNRKIAEVETIVVRATASGAMNSPGAALERLGKPYSIWSEVVPPAERMSRADLIKTANMYFSGLQKNDGKGVYPFSDDCARLENGIFTTAHPGYEAPPQPPVAAPAQQASDSPVAQLMTMSCKAQFSSGWYNTVARIRDRRFMVVDPVHGAVMTFVFFDRDGRPPPPIVNNGKTYQGRALLWTSEISEAFKIEKGEIRFVEAVLTQAPYGMKPNWPEDSATTINGS